MLPTQQLPARRGVLRGSVPKLDAQRCGLGVGKTWSVRLMDLARPRIAGTVCSARSGARRASGSASWRAIHIVSAERLPCSKARSPTTSQWPFWMQHRTYRQRTAPFVADLVAQARDSRHAPPTVARSQGRPARRPAAATAITGLACRVARESSRALQAFAASRLGVGRRVARSTAQPWQSRRPCSARITGLEDVCRLDRAPIIDASI